MLFRGLYGYFLIASNLSIILQACCLDRGMTVQQTAG
jgi:hypothetical protein